MKNSTIQKTVVVSALFIAVGATANAQLVHRYDFATDASDSVGTADGTLYSNGAGNAVIGGGDLTTAAVGGTASSGTVLNGVQLPATAVSGISGAFSIEYWGTISFGGGFTTAFSFSDTTTANYVLATPARGNSPYASSISVIGGGTGLSEQQASGQYFDNGFHQMLVTYDGTTLTYYQDSQTDFGGFNTLNGLSASIVVPGLDLSTLTTIGIAGGAPYPDNSVAADTHDFRIYSNVLSASEVSDLFNLGPDASNSAITAVIPEPSTFALAGFGILGMLMARRRS